ncbi:MAG: O-antigen ligase family protein [Candidatus Portnoybacteria bacterium]|nr:O-antigen ligase family protein [Candidatus Portnoybacteria bacterium]
MLEKAERIFFYLFVFFLPFQTRALLKSFSQPFNEWTSVSFYLTDLLVLAVIFLWIIRIIKKEGFLKIGKTEIVLFLFWLVGALSIFKAENSWLAIFRELKLVEFVFLFLYLKNNFSIYSLIPWKESGQARIEKLALVIISSGLLQSLIAIGQFFRQKSFGLSFLDESPLASDLSGVAKISVEGSQMIRGYGLTPHPNVLAAFLVSAIFVCLYLMIGRFGKNKLTDLGFSGALYVLMLGLAVTFSRTAILFGLLAVFVWLFYLFFKEKYRALILRTALVFSVILLFLTVVFWPLISNRFDSNLVLEGQAYDLRVFYNKTALEFIKHNSLLGVGIGNFVPFFMEKEKLTEAWMYQPAHNLYLLIGSEMGILGLAVFLIFLVLVMVGFYKNAFKKPIFFGIFLLTVSYLLFAASDHYFWTIQQGGLMFWGLLGIMAGKSGE